jgi:hypothetical protein
MLNYISKINLTLTKYAFFIMLKIVSIKLVNILKSCWILIYELYLKFTLFFLFAQQINLN